MFGNSKFWQEKRGTLILYASAGSQLFKKKKKKKEEWSIGSAHGMEKKMSMQLQCMLCVMHVEYIHLDWLQK